MGTIEASIEKAAALLSWFGHNEVHTVLKAVPPAGLISPAAKAIKQVTMTPASTSPNGSSINAPGEVISKIFRTGKRSISLPIIQAESAAQPVLIEAATEAHSQLPVAP